MYSPIWWKVLALSLTVSSLERLQSHIFFYRNHTHKILFFISNFSFLVVDENLKTVVSKIL